MLKTPSTPSSARPPVIVWFRNDLRLGDNAALHAACETGATIVPLFILDEAAAGDWKPGGSSRWWLHHSLAALAHTIEGKGSRLILRRGAAAEVLADIAADVGAHEVVCARRYEPWAIREETACRHRLEKDGITLRRFGVSLLMEPERIATKSGEPYKVYTPFWRALNEAYAPAQPLKPPKALPAPGRWPKSERLESWKLLPKRPNWADGFAEIWTPGEAGAIARLDRFLDEAADDYTTDRNRPDVEGTSRLSPHLAHGEISPRLVWWRVASECARRTRGASGLETFLKELVWREFSQHLLFHFPTFPEAPFRPEFEKFPWRDDAVALRAWQKGLTGYPIVDAGMRQLWATGWMHNRVRMIVASFLIKDLLIPWQEGERWFWDTLVDADLGNNAAGWQWGAGSGADAAPYFRVFNPVTQGEKFDPEGTYVRTWVSEIAALPDDAVHRPFEVQSSTLKDAGIALGTTYPAPIVDHKSARERALKAFAKLKA